MLSSAPPPARHGNRPPNLSKDNMSPPRQLSSLSSASLASTTPYYTDSPLRTPRLSYFDSASSSPPSTASSGPPATPDSYSAIHPPPFFGTGIITGKSYNGPYSPTTPPPLVAKRRSSASSTRRKPVPPLSLEEQLELASLSRTTSDTITDTADDVLMHTLDSMVARTSSDGLLPAFNVDQDRSSLAQVLATPVVAPGRQLLASPLSPCTSTSETSRQNSWISDSTSATPVIDTPILHTPDAAPAQIQWFASPVATSAEDKHEARRFSVPSHVAEDCGSPTLARCNSPISTSSRSSSSFDNIPLTAIQALRMTQGDQRGSVDFGDDDDEDEYDSPLDTGAAHKTVSKLVNDRITDESTDGNQRAESALSIQLSEYQWMSSSLSKHKHSRKVSDISIAPTTQSNSSNSRGLPRRRHRQHHQSRATGRINHVFQSVRRSIILV